MTFSALSHSDKFVAYNWHSWWNLGVTVLEHCNTFRHVRHTAFGVTLVTKFFKAFTLTHGSVFTKDKLTN